MPMMSWWRTTHPISAGDDNDLQYRIIDGVKTFDVTLRIRPFLFKIKRKKKNYDQLSISFHPISKTPVSKKEKKKWAMFLKTIQHIPYKFAPEDRYIPSLPTSSFHSAVDNPLYPALPGLYYHRKIVLCGQWTLHQELGRSCMYAGMSL